MVSLLTVWFYSTKITILHGIGDDEEDDDEFEGGGEWVGVKKAESKRRILSVRRRGNLSGRNL